MWLRTAPLLLSLLGLFETLTAENRWTCRRPHVALTVSPLVNTSTIRSLVLSWALETVMPGDHVLLYLTDTVAEPLFRAEVTTSSGWLDSGVQENRTTWESLAFTEQCLGYWAALRRGEGQHTQVLASSCLGTAPRWMEQNKEALQNLTLRSMFLPGTHNSAAYLESDVPFYDNFVQRYVFNQDERVLNQLIYGARALDLRVGYYPSQSEVWWANHGVVRLRPLSQVLNDVILFANMTKEIVILDFHHFPVGFNGDSRKVHQDLVRYLENYLDKYLLPRSLGWNAPLSELWKTGKGVVLTYNYYDNVDMRLVWPRVVQKWGNVRSLTALRSYLTGVLNNARAYPYAWSAMAELTPTAGDAITGRLGSLRQIAHSVNRNVTEWFRGDWGAFCNIVSVDFLRSSDIVKSAVDWNLRRGRRSKCDV